MVCCRPSAALRSATILKHFLDEHSQLNGTVVQLPSDLLRPSWRPFYPSKAVQPPPPLPPNPKPGCLLVTSAPCAMRNRKHLMLSLPTPSPSSTPFTSPRKQSQRQIPKKAEEDEDELSIPSFGPLPGYPESACLQPQDLVVWRRPTVFDVDVARPQGMYDGPIQETPISILYDVFARHKIRGSRSRPPSDSDPVLLSSITSAMAEAPPPLSFPALLRNPGISSRFSHLQETQQQQAVPAAIKKLKREHEGKRWIQRKDNARFTGNPHIVAATRRDYILPTPQARATFPEPLPPYLPRTALVPTTTIPQRDPITANAGRFSLSLKGMRRGLRKCGFRAESLVRDVEREIVEWLDAGGIVLDPDTREAEDLAGPGILIGDTGTIFQVSRTPLQLVWYTDDDSFARYVVHCCARYHEIVSFTLSILKGKELSGRRLTYLLRPNVTRPDYRAPGALDTPPVTDIDYSSQPDTESDRGGLETDSDIDEPSAKPPIHLPAISEDFSPVSSPIIPPAPHVDDETWSIIQGSDVDGDASCSDADLVVGVESLSLSPANTDPEATPKANLYLRQQASMRRRAWPQNRANSSPSRSPARRPFRRGPLRYDPPRFNASTIPLHQQQSFYDYLFL
ncbi:hypothetical protein D9615_004663 [Tricholomella constricta]|uniref:Uncharacterized protein n=1 Tax=Tricholomella constricta TaxID=117010 RepID=A0A8H5HBV6_9AGAR|nr:hypothetical protein D9615_004663 [Tricholomella constricta]